MEKVLPLFTVGTYLVLLLHYLSIQQLKNIFIHPVLLKIEALSIWKLCELQVVTVKM